MLKKFIDRPVLSTVISIMVVVIGLIGLKTLPVSQYPEIAPPTVQISASYGGANAETVMKSVIVPIEEQVNGVDNMTYITSTASNDGSARITVYFKQGTNPDIAAVNVQNLVAKAVPLLPKEVNDVGVKVKKQQSSNIMLFCLKSKDGAYGGEFVQNYANINILPSIRRVHGVGSADAYGTKDYAMRIWLNPEIMRNYKITPDEVIAAIQDQNIQAAPGELGQNSDQSFQYSLKYKGKLETAPEFENIVIRSSNGHVLRLNDIAKVELGSVGYQIDMSVDGDIAVIMAISQTAGSNAQEILNDIEKVIAESSKSLPPGMEFVELFNANDFLSASIDKVLHTLLEAFLLVFVVVFIFLQDFRSTLIPAIAVPVAIIGTFFFLQLFGFTINLLTLFALVLAIGIVVDDAIVVVESVHLQLDQGGKNALKSTHKAMHEITPAIVSITLVMASVFIPVSFIGGTTGVFYKQFGLTLGIAIAISALNALTLSPALCALFLREHKEDKFTKKKGLHFFFYKFNQGFTATTKQYKKSLSFLGNKRNRWITLCVVIGSIALFSYLGYVSPTGFVPAEDSGMVRGNIAMPPSTSLEETTQFVKIVCDSINTIPEIEHLSVLNGLSFLSGRGSSYGSLIMKLKPWTERKKNITQVMDELRRKTKNFKNAEIIFFAAPTLQGFGSFTGVNVELQDQTGGDIEKFNQISQQFIDLLKESPNIKMIKRTFDNRFYEREIIPNIVNIRDKGLRLSDVMGTFQAFVGGKYVSNFNLYGKQFRVMMQADPASTAKESDLQNLYVKTSSGEMAPITEFVHFKEGTGPQQLSRYNLFTSINIKCSPSHSSGAAIKDIKAAAETLPPGYVPSFSGISREEESSGSQTIYIFALCILFVYLLLSALYESYILPLAVILSLPIGLSGVYLFILPLGINNNIYVQISMIMLVGLLAKNAILIVEYAVQRRKAGMSIVEAGINGAVARLRPILMTSFAFIFGLLPLMFASGAGAIGNRSIGTSAIGGMLVGTVIGILIIPILYIIFQSIQERFSKSGMINGVIILLVCSSLLSSCGLHKTLAPVSTPNKLYRQPTDQDTSSIAQTPWKIYFKDAYLQGLIEEGLSNNFDLQIAFQRIQQTMAAIHAANGAFLPSVAIDGSAKQGRTSSAENTLAFHSENYSLGLSTSWEFDVWGKLFNQKRRDVEQYKASVEYRNWVQTTLVADIANAYYQLQSLDKQLEITHESVQLLQSTTETMIALKEAAVLNGAAVEQSKASLYATQVTIPDLEIKISQLENAICLLIGRTPGAIERGHIDDVEIPMEMKYGVPATMLALRPDVKQAEYLLRAAFQSTQDAKGSLYPSVTLGATIGYGTNSTLSNFFKPEHIIANLIGGLTQPLFERGTLRANVNIAKAKQQEALLTFQKTVLNAGNEVSNELYTFSSAKKKDEIRSKQVQALLTSVDFTKELLKSGNANYIDVLTAEKSLVLAQLQQVNDKLQQLSATVGLYKALGGGIQ